MVQPITKLRWLQSEDGTKTLQFCYNDTDDWKDVPVEVVPTTVELTNPDSLQDIPDEEWERARERVERFKDRVAGIDDPNEIKRIIREHRKEMEEADDTATYNKDGITSPEGIVLDM